MAKPVVIFGTGDYARVASVYLAEDSPREVAAFSVHAARLEASELLGKPVVPFEGLTRTHPPAEFDMLVAVGFKGVNAARAGVYAECKAAGYGLISYVCSRATLFGRPKVGDNTFIFENNVVQPFATIGDDVVLWSGNHVGHDARIGDHCFISSHVVISGRCDVGERCFLGVNSTLRDGVTLGAGCVVGAGAVVLKDLPPGTVVKSLPGEVSPVPSHRLRAI